MRQRPFRAIPGGMTQQGGEKGRLGAVAVLGAGTMGHGIAQVFAAAGATVRLYDIDLGRVEKGRAQIESGLQRVAAKGKISAADVTRITGAISGVTDLAQAVTGTSLVVEAVPEDMSLKVELFKKVSAAAPADAIFASNTSSLSITELGT
ncbi:MAG: 3-hydroxyacyl-CoA dehydrogenase NAD-binding domain-containing protein, partial [Polyangiales bacterium]